ncbi:MAG: cytidylate kinase-like family protein [Desulfobulbus sp.]|nr:cytidylate kinase-like family protein [Desulfobulbus sp.]
MSIVTIARGSYSRGKEVAEKLAEKLGYECISREIILEASNEFNIPEIKLVRALHDSPRIFSSDSSDRYVIYYRSAILQHARNDNIVYHGLAGHFFLKDIPHVLKIRINADMDTRVQEEMKRENISYQESMKILKNDDEERRKWGVQIYGTDTWDSRLYDIVINISSITIDDAVDIIYCILQKPKFKSTFESRKLVAEMALLAKKKADTMKSIGSTLF